MKRLLTMLSVAAAGALLVTGCMGDDNGGSASDERRTGALVSGGPGGPDVDFLKIPELGLKGDIEVLSFSWGGRNMPAGTPALMYSIGVMKTVDAASPKLFEAMATGKRFASAALEVRGPQHTVGPSYRLNDVLVTSVDHSRSGSANVDVSEYVSLSYSKVELLVPTPQGLERYAWDFNAYAAPNPEPPPPYDGEEKG